MQQKNLKRTVADNECTEATLSSHNLIYRHTQTAFELCKLKCIDNAECKGFIHSTASQVCVLAAGCVKKPAVCSDCLMEPISQLQRGKQWAEENPAPRIIRLNDQTKVECHPLLLVSENGLSILTHAGWFDAKHIVLGKFAMKSILHLRWWQETISCN